MARRLDPPRGYTLRLDHPPTSQARPRWGYGKPVHPGIREVLSRHEDTYRSHLETIATYHDDLLSLDLHHGGGTDPCWLNAWLLGLDTSSIYALLRHWAPRRYIEVGSGFSTMLVARARRDGGLPTTITSIDPHPRAGIDRLCDTVLRCPFEDVDLSLFDELQAGDVVFYDSSHRVFTNSDVAAFYFDVLPNLPSGVIVGIHDILWPDDYLPEWSDYWFSEQYVVGAYLLGETPWLTPLLAANYAAAHPELSKILEPLWQEPRLAGVDPRGFVLWLRIDKDAALTDGSP